MSNVILQPASGTEPRGHYIDTVVNPVPISDIEPYLSSEQFSYLTSVITSESVCAWGIVPSGETRWQKIQPGDTVLFARDNHYYSSATVVAKIRSQTLATRLWGTDSQGRTWEWMYFFHQPLEVNIPYSRLNNAVGYSNYTPQGINVLDGQKAEAAFEALFDVSSQPSISDVIDHVDQIQDLDFVSTAIVRKEQGLLRKKLLGNSPVGLCGICGKEYPVQFLVAAHIKKRAECTDEEKANIPAIAMPMCLMGCDALFEKGYVSVVGGQVRSSLATHIGLDSILQTLSGNACSYWNSENAHYFAWHYQNTFRG